MQSHTIVAFSICTETLLQTFPLQVCAPFSTNYVCKNTGNDDLAPPFPRKKAASRPLSPRQCCFLLIEVKFDNFGQSSFQKYNLARCACYSSNKVFTLNQASLQQKSARILQHGRRGTWLASRLVQRKGCNEVDIQKRLNSIP